MQDQYRDGYRAGLEDGTRTAARDRFLGMLFMLPIGVLFGAIIMSLWLSDLARLTSCR